jgi:hypothetical protein
LNATEVPDLVGKSIDEANRVLAALGLSDRVSDGTAEAVRYQHPAPGVRDLAIATVELVTCCDNGGLAFAMPRGTGPGELTGFTPSTGGRACYGTQGGDVCFDAPPGDAVLETLLGQRLVVVGYDPGPDRPILRFDDGLPIRVGGLDSDVREAATVFIPPGTTRVTVETDGRVQEIVASPVPNVVGMTRQNAIALLEPLGFDVEVAGTEDGVVLEQSVRPNYTDLAVARITITVR